MNINNVYIGELYERINSNEQSKIGYKSFIYDEKNNIYISLKTGQKYDTDPLCSRFGPYYIDKETLIPYTSFAKKRLFNPREVVINSCISKIKTINKERIEKIYGMEYTDEEKKQIHDKGELTLHEKVREIMNLNLCPDGDEIGSAAKRCKTFDSCKECITDSLYNTGNRSFKKLEFKQTRHIEY